MVIEASSPLANGRSRAPSDTGSGAANGPVVLDAQRLSKRFRQKKYVFEAVSQVSLQLRSGEILAFLGPNGAGKTTTIKMIAGLVRPDQGTVNILGADPLQRR
jgi:ABC-2 type transport system ATP-binding protein